MFGAEVAATELIFRVGKDQQERHEAARAQLLQRKRSWSRTPLALTHHQITYTLGPEENL